MKKWLARAFVACLILVGIAALLGRLAAPAIVVASGITHFNPLVVLTGILLGLFALWRLRVLREAMAVVRKVATFVSGAIEHLFAVPNLYPNILLTIIALALCAITAKLYLSAADRVGPHLGAPTTGDYLALSQSALTDDERVERARQLNSATPRVNVDGGNLNVEVLGQISVQDPIRIETAGPGPLPVEIIR